MPFPPLISPAYAGAGEDHLPDVADMGAAIFADVGVMVIAVLNAMRALSAAH